MSANWPSRYIYSEQVTTADGKQAIEEPHLHRFRFRDRSDNLQVVARDGERIWHIAHRMYPTFKRAGELYWLLCLYNNIPDPTILIPPGQAIYGPSMRVITEEILGFDT